MPCLELWQILLCSHWLSWIQEKSHVRIWWIFCNSGCPCSAYSASSEAELRLGWRCFSEDLFGWAWNRRTAPWPVCLCSFAQKPGGDKPFDISIFSVCIWLQAMQVLQQIKEKTWIILAMQHCLVACHCCPEVAEMFWTGDETQPLPANHSGAGMLSECAVAQLEGW